MVPRTVPGIKIKAMDLLEKIDELRAKSVTPERFEKVWGISIDQHLKKMMEFVEQQKAMGNIVASAK
ncbi:MAG: hypothetical protein IJ753_00010 [Bacteroidales bacterium]|nr:hypothetical protein [Bacteroidales bacterium]